MDNKIKQTIKEDIEYINDFNILEKYKDIMNDEYNDNDKLNDEFYDNGTVNGESIEIKKIHKENDDIYYLTKTHLINNNIDKIEDLKKFISTYDGGDIPEEYLNFGLTVDDFKQIYNKSQKTYL
jgi:hypothetical protein